MLNHLVPVNRPPSLEPVIPSIRSSDAKFPDDFLYLVRRKYGLVKQGDYSEPLSLGTHFHYLLELEGAPDREARWTQYRASVLAAGEARILDKISNDLDFAYGLWTDIIRTASLSDTGNASISEMFERDSIRSLGSEIKIRYGLRDGASSTIQIDRLIYNSTTNQLSIVDLKSTSMDAQARAAMCPFEFQTWHYLCTLHKALPQVIEHFELPGDTTIGSMMHLIFRKPTIRMSGEDRDYTLNHKEITRGPRKGVIDTIREYHGEPRWHNFVERCKIWYGENPGQVLRSSTHFAGNESLRSEYLIRLEQLIELSIRDPSLPHVRSDGGAVDFRGPSVYYPFYLSPDPAVWPTLAVRHGFDVEHRDPPINLAPNQVRIEVPNV